MELQDDRTQDQRKTHYWAVVARDKFMSGWGQARNGFSRCAWAYPSIEAAEHGLKWVESRKEMQLVSIVDLRTYRPPSRTTAHFHIYVADYGHTSLNGFTAPERAKLQEAE